MFLSDLSIKRPVVATVASILLVVFGLFAVFRLPVRETPNIEQPIVSIRAEYVGASAEVMESKVIKIIEDQISGIEGIKAINASARDGNGNVNIEFHLGRDIDAAANDVRDQVGRAAARLPQDMDPPIIQKADPDSDAIIWMNMSSSAWDQVQLSDYVERNIRPRLSSLDGVALVMIGGERKRALRIWLDRRAMAARGLTVTDIEGALRRENVELGAGMLESQNRDFTLRTIRSYQTPEDFTKLVVARGENNYLVRLGEVAEIEIGPESDRSSFRNNGEPAVGIGVVKRPEASTLAVAEAVKAEIELIQAGLPEDVELVVSNDTSIYIDAALKEVTIAIVVAAGLVIAVIYLFLGTLRAALIPAVTVPISLVATAIVLWPIGFSLNILTLLAMVLAIGLVVDDAIIMLENIHRRMKEHGEPPLLAAYRGARQVGMAVMSTTLVLIAAFVPITMMEGTVGRLFNEFAIAMAVAVAFSLFVAITLTPVMCSKILTNELDDSPLARGAYRVFDVFKGRYRRVLDIALDHPKRVLALFAFLCAGTVGIFTLLPQEFIPPEDRAAVVVQVRSPEGSNMNYTDRQATAATELLRPYIESGEVLRILQALPSGGSGAVNTGRIMIRLAPWEDRDRSAEEFLREITPILQKIPGAQMVPSLPGGFGRGNSNPTLTIGGPTYEELSQWRDKAMEAMRQNPNLIGVRTNYDESKPQMRIHIARDRAADVGVSINTIGQTLAVILGSRRVTTFSEDGEEYNVLLQGRKDDRRTPTDVSNIYVRSDTTRELIALSSLVSIEETAYSDSLNRFNRLRSVNLVANPVAGYTLGELVNDVETAVRDVLPPTARLTWRGEAEEFQDTGTRIFVSFALALVVVFLVLAAQFESFVHPVVIMMTVPLAVFGALLGLLVFGQSFNLYTQIGIIVLVGLAAKNGILIVEFANQLRDSGMKFRDALVEASLIRLRPIIMTGLATCMGAVPLVIASGAGSEGRRAIGVVIMTGVAFASVVTLLIIPVFYQFLARRTGSPGRVAAELAGFEKKHPTDWHGDESHRPAE